MSDSRTLRLPCASVSKACVLSWLPVQAPPSSLFVRHCYEKLRLCLRLFSCRGASLEEARLGAHVPNLVVDWDELRLVEAGPCYSQGTALEGPSYESWQLQPWELIFPHRCKKLQKALLISAGILSVLLQNTGTLRMKVESSVRLVALLPL